MEDYVGGLGEQWSFALGTHPLCQPRFLHETNIGCVTFLFCVCHRLLQPVESLLVRLITTHCPAGFWMMCTTAIMPFDFLESKCVRLLEGLFWSWDQLRWPRIGCRGDSADISSCRCFSGIRFSRVDADSGWPNTKILDLSPFGSIYEILGLLAREQTEQRLRLDEKRTGRNVEERQMKVILAAGWYLLRGRDARQMKGGSREKPVKPASDD